MLNKKSQKSVLLDEKEREIVESASKEVGLSYAGFIRTTILERSKQILKEKDNGSK